MQKTLLTLLLALTPLAVLAQGSTITGTVTDDGGLPLPSANVTLQGTTLGAATTVDGTYRIANVPAGDYTLNVAFLGYETAAVPLTVASDQTLTVDVALTEVNQALAAAEVFASRAIDRRTPVAYTDIPKEQIQQQLGSRDIPLVLNTAPSVYATEQGGGSGDARINVRGFDQRNTAVMINGVPVNDMENGWVYWSNWDGVGDVTTSIQLQRGLSAVNLAVPSVGGTLNILTDPANNEAGVMLQQEVGSGEFLKTSALASTGLVDGKYAVTLMGVRKTGQGVVDATWTDAWAYYGAATLNLNSANTVSLYAVGAPQRHGQNLYRQNIGAYDADFARDLDGYDPAALEDFSEAEESRYESTSDLPFGVDAGRLYNENWNTVSTSYTGDQYFWGGTRSRYNSAFIAERENYYHKPQVNLNWYSQLSDRLLFSTVAYYSGGNGGGSGTLGSLVWDYDGPSRIADWDATIERNAANATGSRGILRNSVNQQWTVGNISKLTFNSGGGLTVEGGLDVRTASIDHYREVRDLLGGAYFLDSSDEFAGERQAGLGDKVDYFNNNTVNWGGGYLQAEVDRDRFTAFAMGGVTAISYNYEDFFRRDPANTGETLKLESGTIPGFTAKTGGLYRASDALGVFANVGYISKVPIFDGVINDGAGVLNDDIQNEDILSFEAGVNYRTPVGAVKLSAYRTNWANRTVSRGVTFRETTTGEDIDATVFLRGVEQINQGVELEVALQPTPLFRIDGGLSVGDWSYTDNVTGRFQLDDRSVEPVTETYYIAGLKVGDQPQTQLAYGLTLYPVEGLDLQLLGRTYSRHYAGFDPISRTDAADVDANGDPVQSWQAPGYTVLDVNASYELPLPSVPFGLELTANLFNALDATYILDATDNSSFNSFDGDHDADDAEVYFGLPRRFNVGLRVRY
jgi:outer membrane cobalamin receptor